MLGVAGSKKFQATIKQGAALAQVRAKLVAQWDGQALPDDPDSLLVDGSANLFPIAVGDTVCVVYAHWHGSRWDVSFYPLRPHHVWGRGDRVFRNK
jgi:hypothetical protein